MRTSAKLILNLGMVAVWGSVALADNEAYRQAMAVPTNQAVLLGRGVVALAVPAQGQIVLLDSMGNVSILAGEGTPGYGGDGGPASQALFNTPTALAVDGSGDVFVADTGNNRIRRIDGVTRVVTTVAGTGEAGYDGDSGPAVGASMDSPTGVALDGAGNLYIADTGNNRIRRVDAISGAITTYAGTGDAGFDSGDVTAVAGHLSAPTGLAFDPSEQRLLIADTENHAIRSVKSDGTLHTFAGTGAPGFSGDGGRATEARLLVPTGVSRGFDGFIYVSDTGNRVVRRIAADVLITTVGSSVQTQIPAFSVGAAQKDPFKVELIAPSSNNWLVGSKQVISWTQNIGAKAQFAVELSRDGGLTWTSIQTVEAAEKTVSLSWVVMAPTTTAALVRVRSLTTPAFDVSQNPITIYVPET